VVLFASLETESWFHSRSDIDLAADGLNREALWRADCRLEQLGNGFEIALVDLHSAPLP